MKKINQADINSVKFASLLLTEVKLKTISQTAKDNIDVHCKRLHKVILSLSEQLHQSNFNFDLSKQFEDYR